MRARAPIIALVLALLPLSAHGQAVCVEYDLNVPAYSGAQDAEHDLYATSRGTALGVGWLSRRYVGGVRGHRWRVRVGYQAYKTEWQSFSPSTGKRSATTIEVGHDWYVTSIGSATWSMGAAFGPVFVSSRNESYESSCDSPFCNLPDGGWQVSGLGCLEVPVSSGVAVLFGIRGRIAGPARAEIFPFAPGPVFSLGVGFGGSR